MKHLPAKKYLYAGESCLHYPILIYTNMHLFVACSMKFGLWERKPGTWLGGPYLTKYLGQNLH